MENTNNSERMPIQESLNDYSGDVNGLTSSNASQRLVLNSLTVQMFEAPDSTATDETARRGYSQKHTKSSEYNQKYPAYQSHVARMSTYKRWPRQIKQTPQELSNVGLFFTGIGDCVCCFYCGGCLRQWAYNDDPWTEHCRLLPLCPFAIEQKGTQFINDTLPSHNEFIKEILHHQSHLQGPSNSDMENQLFFMRVDLEEYRKKFLQMGFEDIDFRKAVIHLNSLGITEPTVDDFVDIVSPLTSEDNYNAIEDFDTYEMSLQENCLLKRKVLCVVCMSRNVGMLFLPCRHNKTCARCGNGVSMCPLCNQKIEEKITTSLPDLK